MYFGEYGRPDQVPIDPAAYDRVDEQVQEAGLKWAEANKPKGSWEELAEKVGGKPTFEIRWEREGE